MARKHQVRSFRAIKEANGLTIQSSLDGRRWISAIGGLDDAWVTKQFRRLAKHGGVVISTPAYRWKGV